MRQILEILTSILGKQGGQTVVIIGCTIWVTIKANDAVGRIESRFIAMEKQMDSMWTVQMQAVRDSMVATHNTNNWIPSAWEIYYSVREGKTPSTVQIKP